MDLKTLSGDTVNSKYEYGSHKEAKRWKMQSSVEEKNAETRIQTFPLVMF